jgi:hypothetical protein
MEMSNGLIVEDMKQFPQRVKGEIKTFSTQRNEGRPNGLIPSCVGTAF